MTGIILGEFSSITDSSLRVGCQKQFLLPFEYNVNLHYRHRWLRLRPQLRQLPLSEIMPYAQKHLANFAHENFLDREYVQGNVLIFDLLLITSKKINFHFELKIARHNICKFHAIARPFQMPRKKLFQSQKNVAGKKHQAQGFHSNK